MPWKPSVASLAAEQLADPETGRLGSIPLDALWVPSQVRLVKDELSFDWRGHRFKLLEQPSHLLERFAVVSSDGAMLEFAQRFGPLGLFGVDSKIRPVPGRLDRLSGKSRHWEALGAWRRYRDEFVRLMQIAVSLQEGRKVGRDIYEEFLKLGVFAWYPGQLLVKSRASLDRWDEWSMSQHRETAASLLTLRTTTFAEWCGLRPAMTVHWRRSEFVAELVFQDDIAFPVGMPGLSLFGALTVELLAVVSGTEFGTCSACGKPFRLKRYQPRRGKRKRYCPQCGLAAARRNAKAKYLSKKRSISSRGRQTRRPATTRKTMGTRNGK